MSFADAAVNWRLEARVCFGSYPEMDANRWDGLLSGAKRSPGGSGIGFDDR